MRSRTTRVVLAAASCSALLLAGTPASGARAVPDGWTPIGGAATLTMTVNGYGHGHGMSQHGAKSRADAGHSHSQILGAYYPGTRLDTLRGKIRVWLTGDADRSTVVKQTRGLRVKDLANGRSYKLAAKKPRARAWRLRTVHGATQVQFRTDRWKVFRPGGRATLVGNGEFSASGSPLTLRTPAGTKVYRGALRRADGKTINVLGLQAYLRGVVATEMPALWPAAALRAQAVAARTYAARARADAGSRAYHICDTTSCQVYRGVAAEHPRTDDAIDATVGQVLTYAGKPAFTQFSASNGGWSSAGSQPYLVARQDTFDTAYREDPVSVQVAALNRRYGGILTQIRVSEREGNRAFGAGGWALTVEMDGNKGTKTVPASEIRTLLGLRSTYFTFTS